MTFAYTLGKNTPLQCIKALQMYNLILPKSSAIFMALTKSIQSFFFFKNSTPDPVMEPRGRR